MKPSLSPATEVPAQLALFPDSTRLENNSLRIGEQDLGFLADRFGTPLYIYDRLTLDRAVETYLDALSTHYSAPARITYAGKAFLCKAIAEWTQTQGLLVDCTGQGEIAVALAGGVPGKNILVHGVNKSVEDLNAALEHAVTIVVDNLTELHRIHVLLGERSGDALRYPQGDMNIWLRLLPGVAVTTHHSYTRTGQQDSKFGMTRDEIVQAANYCREFDLPLTGIHFHQGSNFRDPEPLIPAIDMALDLAREIGLGGEWHFCPGGGWGVAYHEHELPHPSIESYVRGIAEALIEGCRGRGLGLPHLHLEPGRSLIARAGVALYRVGAVKRRGNRTWLLVDGGMADNPRHALYGAEYSCLPVTGVSRERTEIVSIGGPFCESGDVLIENLPMPRVDEGELIAIPMAGAYQLSMSSNYNGARRPAALMVGDGMAQLILARETVQDLLKNQL